MEHEKLTSLNQGSPEGALSDTMTPNQILTSVLLDGELRDEEFAQACLTLESDPQAQQRWHDYQLVGETMRRGELGVREVLSRGRASDALFLSRLRRQLEQEATPRGRVRLDVPIESAPDWRQPGRRLSRRGANDPYGAWRITAGLCVLAVVGMLGWQGVAGLQSASQARQLAQVRTDTRPSAQSGLSRPAMPQRVSASVNLAPPVAVSDGAAQSFLASQALRQDTPLVMLRDPRLDHLMARQGAANVRAASDGRISSPRLGRPGVAAQGVLVNLDKSPAVPR
ncbi:sigma-E factor negative regulatory protein [Leptospira sp. 96542]|nr:sigma-E factor negative regulatory protein [Leptospira sp. 96542]